MNFIEALKAMLDKKKVRRISQGSIGHLYIEHICPCSTVHAQDENGDFYRFTVEDFLGTWELYKEEPKLHTFGEALAAFKSGKTIRREAIRRFEYSAVNSSNPYFEIDDVLANDWIIV